MLPIWKQTDSIFQSTSFIRRMTSFATATNSCKLISIHILHTKDDNFSVTTTDIKRISIHILHTKDDEYSHTLYRPCYISIHILHTKDDERIYKIMFTQRISIHILHTKDDLEQRFMFLILWLFQSTSFTRRMTLRRASCSAAMNFNPHPSHEGWHRVW